MVHCPSALLTNQLLGVQSLCLGAHSSPSCVVLRAVGGRHCRYLCNFNLRMFSVLHIIFVVFLQQLQDLCCCAGLTRDSIQLLASGVVHQAEAAPCAAQRVICGTAAFLSHPDCCCNTSCFSFKQSNRRGAFSPLKQAVG